MTKIKNKSTRTEKLRKSIRKESRERRHALSFHEQKIASQSLQKIIQRQPFFLRNKTFGYYIANDSEIDPSSILNLKKNPTKKFYLPVLQPLNTGKLWFVLHADSEHKTSAMELNCFGIPEPRNAGKPLSLFTLDVVLMPLVAFDKSGKRLGMGGGFYDRSFSFKKSNAHKKPLLIGLAHHCQEWESLPIESWDIPLDAVITDTEIFACSASEAYLKRNFLLRDLHR